MPSAGFPYEVLANGHVVPQGDRYELSRFRGKQVWKEILDITPAVCNLSFERVQAMFNNAVTADFSNKMKARYPRFILVEYQSLTLWHLLLNCWLSLLFTSCQKQQQVPMETHENMFDGICLWMWLVPKLQSLLTAEYMEKLTDMFRQGSLGLLYIF